jgi:iron-sulfur cluster assembly accessory protein
MTAPAKINMKLTPAAEKLIRRMIRFAAAPDAVFKLNVSRGGCSGYAVTFDLANRPAANDVVWDHGGLRLSFDIKSSQLLDGSVVDFVESISHSGFVVHAPQGTGDACSPAASVVPVTLLTGK